MVENIETEKKSNTATEMCFAFDVSRLQQWPVTHWLYGSLAFMMCIGICK